MTYSNDTALVIDTNLTHVLVEEYALPKWITYILIGLHLVIVGISLIGNGIILIYFLLVKRGKTNANYYLVALAMSDLLLVIWCEPFTVFNNLINYHWLFGKFMCYSVSFMQTASVIQRSCTLVASSVDRYIAIRWPLRKQASLLVVIAIITAIWFFSLILSVPVAIFTDIKLYNELDNSSGICIEDWPQNGLRQAYSSSLFIVTYCIPLLVLIITYGHIVLILDVKPPGEEYGNLMRRRRIVKRKTIKVFLLAFFAYALCWLPIHTITIVGDINPLIYDSKLVHVVWLFAQCLAVSTSAINPMIVLGSERMARTVGRRTSSERRSGNPFRKGSFNLLKSRMNKRRSTQETWQ
ncbi:RYamide receptor-like [Ruditapes philippinarum]|uniref:RYamide receptor-like n=1 Tax=Ruditapes philippinarum TaxID=129788 RepID=UPI00295AF54C|nr:RYamide receptor-like [Ruditapes philippinarum]